MGELALTKTSSLNLLRKLKRALLTAIGSKQWDLMEGAIDYFYRFPNGADSWGGPFNGQHARLELFKCLLSACKPVAIVETGTYRGASTEFMADFSRLPIYSVEANPRHFAFAAIRLRKCRNVTLSLKDSRLFLKKFAAQYSSINASNCLLFYLDAHWNEHLPLRDEISIIFSSFSRAIVMIDDFQVPGDAGYAYDDYGAAGVLTGSYIASLVRRYCLAEFYPTTAAANESGSRRGCVVLASDPELVDILSRISLLQKWLSVGC
jgi:hypothetical protein